MKQYRNTVLLFFLSILFLLPIITSAQNWVELPPYNTLWPLWSPALSPVSDITGVPTPLVTSLASDTVLPVMPGLTWDPSLPYPWLLYNTLSGLAYFDPLAGINLWPAPSLINETGVPLPLELPLGFADLPPTDATWLANNVFPANNSYILSYQSFLPALAGPVWLANPPSLSSLLTPLDILGPTLGVPSALAPPPLPLPVTPAPTVLAPTAAVSPLVAEQAGTWIGRWYEAVGFLYGEMTMVIVDAATPANGSLTGIVTLLGNAFVPLPINVTGSIIGGAAVELSGIDPSYSYQLIINGILTSPTVMSGTWMVIDLKTGILAKDGSGTFEVSLINPVVAPPPATVAPIAPTAAISQIVPLVPLAIAEQVGTWQGTWSTGLTNGPMTLNLGEVIDPLTGVVTLIGYVQLLGNPWLGTLIDNLEGSLLNNQIYVTGSGIGAGNTNYTIEIVGTLTSISTMTGVYTLIGTANSIKEVGSFDLTLLPPII